MILAIIFLLRGGIDIIAGLFIFFPIIYIVSGALCSDAFELLSFNVLSACAFLIPVNVCFNMGTCIGYALVYIALSIVSFIIKRRIKRK